MINLVKYMNSRMEKYNNNESMSRTKRNSDVYSKIDSNELSKIQTNNNISIISDASKEIDLNKIKAYLESNNEKEKRRIKLDDIEQTDKVTVQRKEIKEYDINSILEEARKNRNSSPEELKYRKVDEKEYELLNSIKLENNDEETEDLSNELNTNERTIVNFIQNEKNKSKSENTNDLFGDLISNDENTKVLGVNILDEIEKEADNLKKESDNLANSLLEEKVKLNDLLEEDTISDNEDDNDEEIKIKKIDVNTKTTKMPEIDKTFFTNSLSFKKSDFASLDEDDDDGGSGFYGKFAIAMIIITLIATIVIVLNYVLEFNWF